MRNVGLDTKVHTPSDTLPIAQTPRVNFYELLQSDVPRNLIVGPETGGMIFGEGVPSLEIRREQIRREQIPREQVDLGKVGAKAPAQLTGWNFDWDDNIFFMPTQIRLYHRDTGEARGVSTADFALIREKVGKEGEWKDYEMRPDSLAAFGDDPTGRRNFFREDVEATIAALSKKLWQGPSWRAFVTACSRKETAKHTTIITARLHSPETIHEGLQALKRMGLIRYLPPIENIYPVNYPPLARELGGSASNPSEAKAIVMKKILDRIEAQPLGPRARKVLSPDGTTMKRMHLWGFSDDDYGNFAKARDALAAEARRWPNVKIVVFFTGKNHPTEKPRAEVILPNGETRLATRAEIGAAKGILGDYDRAFSRARRD
jgi:hypothetical protein